jgi:hypothetical protein
MVAQTLRKLREDGDFLAQTLWKVSVEEEEDFLAQTLRKVR